MADKLDHDLIKAADAQKSPLPVEQDSTHKVYYIYTEQMHQQASHALREKEDHASIQRGLDDRAHGREQPLAEVDAEIRQEFGFPSRG